MDVLIFLVLVFNVAFMALVAYYSAEYMIRRTNFVDVRTRVLVRVTNGAKFILRIAGYAIVGWIVFAVAMVSHQ